MRERRDDAKERLRRSTQPKHGALQERLRRAQQTEAQQKAQATQRIIDTAISVGTTVLTAFLGRKSISVGTIGRATTAARGAGRVLKEQQDVSQAQETVAAVQQDLVALDAELQSEIAALDARSEPDRLEPVAVRPKKTDVRVRLCALAWTPYWRDRAGTLTPAWT